MKIFGEKTMNFNEKMEKLEYFKRKSDKFWAPEQPPSLQLFQKTVIEKNRTFKIVH